MITVIPAYGRDYRSQKEVKQAWEEGKDFMIVTLFGGNYGRYVNKEYAPSGPIFVRYSKNRKIVQVQN